MTDPRINPNLFGHQELEQLCLQKWQKKIMPHSLLLCGPQGIGKATFAYRLARFILNGGQGAGALFGPEDLSSDSESAVSKRIAANAHGDLLIIESDEKKSIRIDTVRKVSEFLSLTAAESGWQVVIIDSADDLNANAANALLKTLEEPPAHSIILLVSHNPGKLLPTIRSRCRKLTFQPLNESQFSKVLQSVDPSIELTEIPELFQLSLGSPGLAITLRHAKGAALYQQLLSVLSAAPQLNGKEAAAMIQSVADARKPDAWFSWRHGWDTMLQKIILLQNQVAIPFGSTQETAILTHLSTHFSADHWHRVREFSHRWFVDTEILHMDRKHVIHSLLNAACGARME